MSIAPWYLPIMSRRGLSSHFPLCIFRTHPSKTPANVLFKGDTYANAFTKETKTCAQKKDGELQGNVPHRFCTQVHENRFKKKTCTKKCVRSAHSPSSFKLHVWRVEAEPLRRGVVSVVRVRSTRRIRISAPKRQQECPCTQGS